MRARGSLSGLIGSSRQPEHHLCKLYDEGMKDAEAGSVTGLLRADEKGRKRQKLLLCEEPLRGRGIHQASADAPSHLVGAAAVVPCNQALELPLKKGPQGAGVVRGEESAVDAAPFCTWRHRERDSRARGIMTHGNGTSRRGTRGSGVLVLRETGSQSPAAGCI